MIQLAAGIVGSIGYQIVDNALGRPLELWARTVDRANDPTVRRAAYQANRTTPNMLPSPDAIISGYRRGLIHANLAAWYLLSQGIYPPLAIRENVTLAHIRQALNNAEGTTHNLGELWGHVGYMSMSRPGPDAVARLRAGQRLDNDEWHDLRHSLDADWGSWLTAARAQYQSPGLADLWQLWKRGAINDAEYQQWSARVGWTNTQALALQNVVTILPTVQEALLANWRGALGDIEFRIALNSAGYTDDRLTQAIIEANRPLPSPSDLVRFAVREVWDEQVVQRWGYDDEFPEPFAHWAQWWGLNWGQAFQLPNGQQSPAVTWPKAWWRAHWQIMSPEQAYRALHLLRPDQLNRYRELSPDVRAFTVQDMATVLKVADYPKPMRDWLQAIAFVPLRLVDLRNAYRLRLQGDGSRDWAINRLLDRGMVREDANTTVDLWERQNRTAAIESLINSQPRRVYNETLAGYREGWLTREDASASLTLQGFPLGFVDRELNLVDAREERASASETLRLLRREFLGGALSYQETVVALRSIRLTSQVTERLLRRWLAQRTVARRALSTSQIVQLVATGALGQPQALQRLGNLGWADTEAALLLSQGVARLQRAQAAAARLEVASARQRQRELLAAQRSARTALNQAQQELRRITPLATLRRWYQLGIRQAGWILARLLAMGYDRQASDLYLSQWAIEYEGKQDSIPPAVANTEELYKRQTPVGTVKRWFQYGISSETWTRLRLLAMGYLPETIEGYIREWRTTLPRGATGPAPETAVATAPIPTAGAPAPSTVTAQTGTQSAQTGIVP